MVIRQLRDRKDVRHHARRVNRIVTPSSMVTKMELLRIMLLFWCSISIVTATTSWSYADQEAWESVSSWECDGSRQSPINVVTSNLRRSSTLVDLNLTYFDEGYDGNWTNTGHSVQFIPDTSDDAPTVVNHLGTYELSQFHFHWGGSSALGSEHQVDGSPYSGELHFVTRKTTGSATDSDAYAVIGVLLESDSSVSLSGIWEDLANAIPEDYGDYTWLEDILPMDLLPDDLSYYYYQGSLTTPGCSEVVQWFLLRNAVSIPADFLEALRTTVNDEDGEVLEENYRDTQSLNGRQVMILGSGSPLGQSSFTITLLVLVSLMIQGLNH